MTLLAGETSRDREPEPRGPRPPGSAKLSAPSSTRWVAAMSFAGLLVVAGCASSWRDHAGLVEPGMTTSEVLDLLGEPSSRVEVPPWGERPARVRWQWNDNLSTLATGAMFPDTVPERVLAVTFDDQGVVVEITRPREAD